MCLKHTNVFHRKGQESAIESLSSGIMPVSSRPLSFYFVWNCRFQMDLCFFTQSCESLSGGSRSTCSGPSASRRSTGMGWVLWELNLENAREKHVIFEPWRIWRHHCAMPGAKRCWCIMVHWRKDAATDIETRDWVFNACNLIAHDHWVSSCRSSCNSITARGRLGNESEWGKNTCLGPEFLST